MNTVHRICVFSASSTKVDEAYFHAAESLGKAMVQRGVELVNGAGKMGLMGACADSVLASGGKVTGVIPRFMVEQGWHHKGLSQLIITEDMHERKQKMSELSDGIIALPGGCGTLEELLEVITWKQLGLYLNPIVLLNTNGYFNPLLDMFHTAIHENFMRACHEGIWQVTDDPMEAVNLVFTTPKWDKEIRKFAEI